MKTEERTYTQFLAKYGSRPKDIVFSIAYKDGYEAGKVDCAKTHFKPDWEINAKLLKDARDEAFEAGKKEAARELIADIKVFLEDEDSCVTIDSYLEGLKARYGLEDKQNG